MSYSSKEELYRALEAHYFGPQMDEEREVRALPGILRGASVFVDVGASLGQYTHAANEIMQNGLIYAIEADPVRFQRLRELCEEWAKGPQGNRIVPLNAAISDETGTANFFVTDADRSGGLFPYDGSEGERPYQWRKVKVEASTLDNLFPSTSFPDLLKVDVEGGEYRVLLGAKGLLQSGRTRFMVEVHPWGDPTIGKKESDVFDLLYGFGYDFKRLHHHWLFAKSGSRMRLRLKNRVIHVIMDHPSVRANVRRLFRGRR